MKLHSITIKNVKSFREVVTFEPNKDFNVLIGSNGSGKSNLMEIIYITLRHYFVQAFQWSRNRGNDGLIKRADKLSQPFGQIGQVLLKYSGDHSESIIRLVLEVTESDVENLRLIQQKKDELLNNILPTYSNLDSGIREFLRTAYQDIQLGEKFEYEIRNHGFQMPQEEKSLYFLRYLRNIEGLKFLAQEVNLELHPIILYISPFRGVSNLSLEQSLSSASSNGERTEVMKSTSRSTSSLIKLATLYFAEKRRGYESLRGGWEARWSTDREVQFVNRQLQKIGYTWDLNLIDANKNTYIIRLKKDGNEFLLNQASSGEVELINFIFGMITLGMKGGIIIVDEPELHLHPKWIAVLRGFFMEYAFTEKNQMMIVTHSGTFINSSTYPYISRLYKLPAGNSMLHQVVDVNQEETKDRLHFINATNNEKVFFSDFVIMVEGDTDEVVFRRILDVIKKERDYKANIEVMQVHGKTNYEKFRDFLKSLQIESCFIGDIDNIAQMAIGNADIKSMLMTNEKRVERLVLKNPGSKDNLKLVELLGVAIQTDDIGQLKGFYDYMLSFRQKLRPNLLPEERQRIDAFIDSLYEQNIFLLKAGEIEAYFPDGLKHKDLEKVLKLTQGVVFEQWKTHDGYKALKDLLEEILRRNHII